MGGNNLAVIGSGIMGRGISLLFALNSLKVALYDSNPAVLEKTRELITADLQLLIVEGLVAADQCQQILNNIILNDCLQTAVKAADFIIEAVPEQLSLKWQVLADIEAYASSDAIIASNTSTLPLSKLSQHLARPERMIITHFFNPAHLVPLVEIIKTTETPAAIITFTLDMLRQAGKTPIMLKREVPGFIANRLQAAVLREALYLLKEGVAKASDLDAALTAGPGFRWSVIGPLETADYGGLDTWQSVMNNLMPELDSGLGVPEAIVDLNRQGHLGVKTGQGFYAYPTAKCVAEKIRARDLSFIRLLKLRAVE